MVVAVADTHTLIDPHVVADMSDRIIAATALQHHTPLISRDGKIREVSPVVPYGIVYLSYGQAHIQGSTPIQQERLAQPAYDEVLIRTSILITMRLS